MLFRSNVWYAGPAFIHGDRDRFEKVTVSLIPFRTSGRLSAAPVAPDDRVHVQVRLPGGGDDGITLSDVRLDPTTQQLVGSGPRMAAQDLASLWLISFYVAPAPPQ